VTSPLTMAVVDGRGGGGASCSRSRANAAEYDHCTGAAVSAAELGTYALGLGVVERRALPGPKWVENGVYVAGDSRELRVDSSDCVVCCSSIELMVRVRRGGRKSRLDSNHTSTYRLVGWYHTSPIACIANETMRRERKRQSTQALTSFCSFKYVLLRALGSNEWCGGV
jgi:hypothetical protein